jgi:hypothetical protein
VNKGKKKGRGFTLRPFPIGVLGRPRSVHVVDGLDALALILEAELLVAALLARLLVRRRFRPYTSLVTDGDGRARVGDSGAAAVRHQVGAAASAPLPVSAVAATGVSHAPGG